MKRKFLALILLFSSSQVQAFECEGFTIQYVPSTPQLLKGQVAAADIDSRGNRRILYDAAVMRQLPQFFQDHIFAHECAHHRFDDVNPRKTYDESIGEPKADCEAVKLLKWNAAQVNELISYWQLIMPNKVTLKSRSESLRNCLSE